MGADLQAQLWTDWETCACLKQLPHSEHRCAGCDHRLVLSPNHADRRRFGQAESIATAHKCTHTHALARRCGPNLRWRRMRVAAIIPPCGLICERQRPCACVCVSACKRAAMQDKSRTEQTSEGVRGRRTSADVPARNTWYEICHTRTGRPSLGATWTRCCATPAVTRGDRPKQKRVRRFRRDRMVRAHTGGCASLRRSAADERRLPLRRRATPTGNTDNCRCRERLRTGGEAPPKSIGSAAATSIAQSTAARSS